MLTEGRIAENVDHVTVTCKPPPILSASCTNLVTYGLEPFLLLTPHHQHAPARNRVCTKSSLSSTHPVLFSPSQPNCACRYTAILTSLVALSMSLRAIRNPNALFIHGNSASGTALSTPTMRNSQRTPHKWCASIDGLYPLGHTCCQLRAEVSEVIDTENGFAFTERRSTRFVSSSLFLDDMLATGHLDSEEKA
jgi:hypothetical protein